MCVRRVGIVHDCRAQICEGRGGRAGGPRSEGSGRARQSACVAGDGCAEDGASCGNDVVMPITAVVISDALGLLDDGGALAPRINARLPRRATWARSFADRLARSSARPGFDVSACEPEFCSFVYQRPGGRGCARTHARHAQRDACVPMGDRPKSRREGRSHGDAEKLLSGKGTFVREFVPASIRRRAFRGGSVEEIVG